MLANLCGRSTVGVPRLNARTGIGWPSPTKPPCCKSQIKFGRLIELARPKSSTRPRRRSCPPAPVEPSTAPWTTSVNSAGAVVVLVGATLPLRISPTPSSCGHSRAASRCGSGALENEARAQATIARDSDRWLRSCTAEGSGRNGTGSRSPMMRQALHSFRRADVEG